MPDRTDGDPRRSTISPVAAAGKYLAPSAETDMQVQVNTAKVRSQLVWRWRQPREHDRHQYARLEGGQRQLAGPSGARSDCRSLQGVRHRLSARPLRAAG